MAIEIVLTKPSEKQDIFLRCTTKFIAFGGARGGGKSHGVRLRAVISALKWPGIRILICRRTYPELIANHIDPLKKMLKVGVKGSQVRYNSSEKKMTFRNGSSIKFDYCQTDGDIDHFQGQEYDLIFVDEATQWKEEWLVKLNACLRGVNNFPKHVIYTCNPGGVSHGYIKRLFIDKRYKDGEVAEEYSFIASSVYDNKVLMQTNPDYVKQLEALPEKLKLAWLYGRWDVFEGAYFEEFRDSPDPQMCHDAHITTEQALEQRRFTHVIKPFDIPRHWTIYRSYDWGYGKPFAFTYYAVTEDDKAYMILEVYGCTKTPNEGIKWSNKQQFDYIQELEATHPWLKGKQIRGVADPSIWDGSHGISAAEEADRHQIWFEKGVNDRIPGWMQVRERLKFDKNGFPMLYIFSNCENTIRTLPLMMYDEHKVEDLDSDLEDHIADTIRYFCMSRPIAPRSEEEAYLPISDPLNQVQRTQDEWIIYNMAKGR